MDEYNKLLFNPVISWINVNQACNLRCKWCYAQESAIDPQREMTLKMAKSLVDLSVDIGVQEFVIIGGEPTLWPHLYEILSYIKEHGAAVSIITNAILFSNDDFWEQYRNNPATSLGISVKAATPKDFQRSTGSSLYEESLKGIKRAINFHHCGISVVHNNLLGVNGTLEIAKLCKQMGAEKIQLVLCTPTFVGDTISTEFVIPPTSIQQDIILLSESIEDLYGFENVNYDLQSPLCLLPKEFVKKRLKTGTLQTMCHVFSRSGVNFDIDGNVIFCNTVYEIIARRGIDYTDKESLLEFMNAPKICEDYLQVLRYPSHKCDDCLWNESCRGGCLMNWFVYNPENICNPVTD